MNGSADRRRVELWTIGHSNHPLESFISLLKSFRIDVVADVRAHPYARYASHFSQAPLRRLLADAGLQYVFMGRELGGRPDEPELYDSDGRVLYGHRQHNGGTNPDAIATTIRIANLAGDFGRNEHLLPAAAFVQAFFPLVVFFGLQRFFVRGILAGSVKG